MSAAESSGADVRRRLDVYRAGSQFLAVARLGGGSLGTVYEGRVDGDAEALGSAVLGWIAAADALDPPDAAIRYPEDLLPTGWQAGHWYGFMRTAELCSVERRGADRLHLRPYKNLGPVGEEFSHEGGHALECATEPVAMGAGVDAALKVSGAISKVKRSPSPGSQEPLHPEVLRHLARLGARLFERTPHGEIIEVAEGFCDVPAALRQLNFDVVWRRGSRLEDQAGTVWEVRWFPVSSLTPHRAWPLMCLALTPGAQIVLRFDTPSPADPEVYQLAEDADAADVLGPAEGPPAEGIALSRWLSELSPA
ncbi:MAG: hypothetical protein AAFY88_15540 [Acidobacteriota bacterium]